MLEDGSIGFWGSEGACGRIADNLKEFFEFMVNIAQKYVEGLEK